MGTIYQFFYILYPISGDSEATLAVLQFKSAHNALTLLAIAAAGNTPGGLTSWLVGKLIARRWPTQKLLKPEHQRAANWLENHSNPLTRKLFLIQPAIRLTHFSRPASAGMTKISLHRTRLASSNCCCTTIWARSRYFLYLNQCCDLARIVTFSLPVEAHCTEHARLASIIGIAVRTGLTIVIVVIHPPVSKQQRAPFRIAPVNGSKNIPDRV